MLLERYERRPEDATSGLGTAKRAAVFGALSELFCPGDVAVLADSLGSGACVQLAHTGDDRLDSAVPVSPDVDGLAAYVQAIELLAESCSAEGRFDDPRYGLREETLDAARAWLLNAGNMGTLSAEHRRLFGGRSLGNGLPEIAPYGAWYFEDAEGTAAEVSRLYKWAGYRPVLADTCPTHIANELGFIAACFSESADDRLRADGSLDRFMRSHVMNWALLFAAATAARADHPVLKFAGLALEDTLFIQWERLGD